MWVQFPSWCKGSVPSSHARGLGFKPHWRKYSFHFMDIEQPSLYCACFVENCQTGPNKRENRDVGTVMRLFVSYLFGSACSVQHKLLPSQSHSLELNFSRIIHFT